MERVTIPRGAPLASTWVRDRPCKNGHWFEHANGETLCVRCGEEKEPPDVWTLMHTDWTSEPGEFSEYLDKLYAGDDWWKL